MTTTLTGTAVGVADSRAVPTATAPVDTEANSAASLHLVVQSCLDQIAKLKACVAYLATGGGTNTAGLTITLGSAGHAVQATGHTTGAGIAGAGGTTSGAGGLFTGGAPDGDGVSATGDGAGRGGNFTGGDNSGIGVRAIGGATNGVGVLAAGTGTGKGLVVSAAGAAEAVVATGGVTGDKSGIDSTGGTTNGAGVWGHGTGAGAGIVGDGGATSGRGGSFLGGAPNGKGCVGSGDGTAAGIQGNGGDSSGKGGDFYGGAPNGLGAAATGIGSGAGFYGQGGDTGYGIEAIGGATSGAGVYAHGANTAAAQAKVDGYLDLSGAAYAASTTAFEDTITPWHFPKVVVQFTIVGGNGGGNFTITDIDGTNVTSITWIDADTYRITFAKDFDSTNYALVGNHRAGNAIPNVEDAQVTHVDLNVWISGTGSLNLNASAFSWPVAIAIYGKHA